VILITGDTYPHRAQLRAMGGEWDAGQKGWLLPEDQAGAARVLVAQGRRGRAAAAGSRWPYRRAGAEVNVVTFGDGQTFTRNRRGRCEDAPCCGCCDI
jgi:hypothetical protein